MADGRVVIETDLDNSGIKSGLSKMQSLAQKGFGVAAKSVAAVTTGMVAAGGAAAKVGMDFEAGMSRVQAISGATGSEFQSLKDQAIDLGASTAFSAGEAAAGMENLASAGFNTNEIMSAMPGMLDLAASSGEDLASSADIAASTLRGFGLEAADAGHVADVLAKNASMTNAAVADTGEAMKYIAPVAHAMGISMEETAAAIGIMSDAGIKGSQAGTSLRGALSRLAKPTKAMNETMEEFGLSFYDAKGNMLGLSEMTAHLKDKLGGLTQEQRNQALITLYGQESLSGMLALMDAGPEKLASLTDAYVNSDGAAKEMAETMQDNLKSALEQVGGAAETMAIKFYESVQGDLKTAAQSAGEYINSITKAFEDGGLEGAIEKAGDIFAELVVKAADTAPEMIESASSLIKSFVSGLVKNKDKIYKSAIEIASALLKGLTNFLPADMKLAANRAIRELTKSFRSGELKSAIDTIVSMFGKMLKIVGEVAKVALPPLVDAVKFAADNIDILAGAAGACFTAFLAYKVVSKASAVMKSYSAVVATLTAMETANTLQAAASTGALTLKQAAVGLLTGKITLATAAQTIWNAVMAANPIGLVATAIAALVAGIAIYNLVQDDTVTKEELWAQKMQEANDIATEQAEELKAVAEARQESVKGIEEESSHWKALWDEMQTIVDQNGNIKAGHEDRANTIKALLEDELGVTISVVDGQIQEYSKLRKSIEDVIETKRQEAILEVYKDDYKTALKERADAEATYAQSLKDQEESQKKYNDALKKKNDLFAEFEANGYEIVPPGLREAEEAVNDLSGALDDANSAVGANKASLNEYSTTIANYETAIGAVESGSDTASEAIAKLSGDFRTAGSSTAAELDNQANVLREKYANIKTAAQEGGSSVTDEAVANAQAMYLLSLAEYGKLSGMAQEEIDKFMSAANEALETGGEVTIQTAKTYANKTGSEYANELLITTPWSKNAANTIRIGVEDELGAVNTRPHGQSAGSEFAGGVSDNQTNASNAATGVANAALGALAVSGYNEGYNLSSGTAQGISDGTAEIVASATAAARSALDIMAQVWDEHSPSREGRKLGRYLPQGVALGIDDTAGEVTDATENMADKVLDITDAISNVSASPKVELSGIDLSGTVARMQASVKSESLRLGQSMTSTVMHKLIYDASQAVDPILDIDYEKLAGILIAAMNGVNVLMDKKPVGKILAPVLDDELGILRRRMT